MEAADCWQQSSQAITEPQEMHDDNDVILLLPKSTIARLSMYLVEDRAPQRRWDALRFILLA